ncbi:TrkH family potassium uptake protein [Pseudaeromonas paramecii]|uniref:Trk system potassium uptake protein n=1 Tax=Pseudaeromonas paramecii TaxID=2138166 RepID=A0ABP8Q0U7_9GAMM
MLQTRQLMLGLHLSLTLMFFYSVTMLPPVFIGLFFHEQAIWPFLQTFGLVALVGGIGSQLTRQHRVGLKHRDGFWVLVLFWCLFSAVSALPFLLSHELGLDLASAFFEAISGITTTGASALKDVDGAPKAFLYYRAQLNFCGGLGIIILAVALLPIMGTGGAKLYQTEAPGAAKDEKITPRLADTARSLWSVYAGLGLLCCLAYWLAGMSWFDALCHGIATVSLGGFSTYGDSLAHFDSLRIELVAGLFSLLAAVNFALYFMALRRRSLVLLWRNSELRGFLVLAAAVILFTCFWLWHAGQFGWQEALVHGFFQAASMMTDNGLGAAGYPDWPLPTALVLVLASFFGGCVGSTCGGLKIMRLLILYRQLHQQILEAIHPYAVAPLKLGDKKAPVDILESVSAFVFIYLVCTLLFIWGLSLTGLDLLSAIGTTAACINNMGIGYGVTAAGFAPLSNAGKWLMNLAMLFGRLEILPILIVISPRYWRY